MVVVVRLQMLTKHLRGLNTGRREVRWLELHPADGREGRDEVRLRRN